MILSCSNINKSFIEVPILTDVSFHLEDKEKAAIVGINGAGKSTLLKIIIGELPADSGNVSISKDKTIGYLAQYQDISLGHTIFGEMLEVKKDIIEMEETIRDLEEKMQHVVGDELNDLMDQYAKLNHSFELKNGYAYKSEIYGVLKGLGFAEEDYEKAISSLSGGQKTRVALAKLLLSQPDIILLDEPTNHLDIKSITWLEGFLSNYKGAVLIVSHDRYFLNKIVSKVVEIENTKSHVYMGNYNAYAKKKEELRNATLKLYYKQQKELKHEQEVIEKLRSFKQEKFYKRAQSREKAIEHMDLIDAPETLNDKFRISLTPEFESGNDVLNISNMSVKFDDASTALFNDVNFEIKKGERIAIIGENGTGKSTLLKIITGNFHKFTGDVEFGSNVSIGYYDQEHHTLNDSKTLFEEISDTYPGMTNTKIRNTLAAFLFTGDDVFKLVGDLSGGEKGRLSLAKLMLSNANFLILDEPTNHLDMVSKEILEDALNSYTGTVLYVSHDRYFINKTCSRILELSNNTIINYIGNYDYYIEKRELQNNLVIENQTSDVIEEASTSTSSTKDDWKKQKELSRQKEKLTKELNKVEDEINSLEEKKAKIEEDMANPLFSRDAAKLISLQKDLESTNEKLDELFISWEEVSGQLEELEQ
ncbi:ribosomal protection-like ABC-F family protein [Eubacterium sp.]|uniref:ribosomal protection-like ABC-F family protein n=1 Tax=Eubacterium sp. TaxID=142586 RepID=UPI0025F5EA19|nr:ABC-F family ATP-binding cassette domain-containing protein [Eubacterium sp.]MCR5628644.1 ABC-F family ATP-binding cassette domain-containing protein [Eubacterium sp.]